MISFLSRNIQHSHIINILLASFARSLRQVMDPLFFSFLVFMAFALRAWAIKEREKTRSITCRTDPANEATQNVYFILQWETEITGLPRCKNLMTDIIVSLEILTLIHTKFPSIMGGELTPLWCSTYGEPGILS